MATVLRLLEVFGLRAVPGLLNLTALLLVARWLPAGEYAVYSTVVATSGFVASLIFGPLTFGVVSQHATLAAKGLAQAYERSVAGATLALAAAVGLLGAGVAHLAGVSVAWVLPAVAFGVYTAVQEIPHARLRFWSYGAAALTQAVVLIGLLWALGGQPLSADRALACFGWSYAVASLMSLALSRTWRLGLDTALLAKTYARGGGYTLSVFTESGLYLGGRYLVAGLGTVADFATFSFCLDLAQRLVGFLISLAGFALVPRAFRQHAEGSGSFLQPLLTGAAVSAVLAVISVAVVAIAESLPLTQDIIGGPFHLTTYVVISAAVVVNRMKKLVLDPLVLRDGNTLRLVGGYALGGFTMALLFLTMEPKTATWAALCVLAGYLVTLAQTLFSSRHAFASQ